MSSNRWIDQTIKKIQYRLFMNVAAFWILFTAFIGAAAVAVLLLGSLWIPIYYAKEIALGLFGVSVLIGLIISIWRFPRRSFATLTGDSKGLNEALITASELRDCDDLFSQLQREQTYALVQSFSIRKAIPFHFPAKVFSGLTAMLLLAAICTLVQTPAKEQAQIQHEIAEKVSEKAEKIEEIKKEITENPQLTELEKDQLIELLENTLKDMEKIQSLDEVEKLLERLDMKLTKSLEDSVNKNFEQMVKNIAESLSLPSDEKLKQAMEAVKDRLKEQLDKLNQQSGSGLSTEELEELAEQLTQMANSGEAGDEDLSQMAANSGLDAENLKELVEDASQSLSGESPTKTASGDSASSQGKGQDSGNNGEGQDNGDGDGSGTGTGTGDGNGSGTGWNQGSSTGFEKTNLGTPQELLNLPDRELGNDANLTGQKSSGGDSYRTSSSDGLAWSGQSVDYNSVIGEYSNNAYHQIDSSSIPEVMKDMIKNYFSGLTP